MVAATQVTNGGLAAIARRAARASQSRGYGTVHRKEGVVSLTEAEANPETRGLVGYKLSAGQGLQRAGTAFPAGAL